MIFKEIIISLSILFFATNALATGQSSIDEIRAEREQCLNFVPSVGSGTKLEDTNSCHNNALTKVRALYEQVAEPLTRGPQFEKVREQSIMILTLWVKSAEADCSLEEQLSEETYNVFNACLVDKYFNRVEELQELMIDLQIKTEKAPGINLEDIGGGTPVPICKNHPELC